MAMTPEETKTALLDFANNYCKAEWTAETAPERVNLFIEKAAEYLASQQGLSGKRLGDMQVTYSTEFPKSIMDLLGRPKVVFV